MTTAALGVDRRADRYCRPVGTHHLAVAPENEATFRATALAAGYPLPPATPDGSSSIAWSVLRQNGP